MKEKINNEMMALSIFFLHEFQKENSKYKLFLEYLPKSMSEHPLFYNREKRQFLKGSFLLDKLLIWESQLKDEFATLNEIKIAENFRIKNFNLDAYKFFRALIWSRNFNAYYNNIGYSSLIPVADLCNTDPFRINTNWCYEEKSEKFIIKATRKINKNEEVYRKYEKNIIFNP